MNVAAPSRARTVALVGNPNTGKTTLFNALTGFRAKVGNYPGVTVERKVGPLRALPGVEVLDLPGTYSLAARSPDEVVAVDVLLGRRADTNRPDVAVVVVDASNLERNLYLASQVVETGLPVVLALTMTDVAKARGHVLDLAALERALGVPVVPLVAHRGEGVDALVAAVGRCLEAPNPPRPWVTFPPAFEAEVAAIDDALASTACGRLPAAERRRLLLDVGGHAEARAVAVGGPTVGRAVAAARARLEAAGTPVAGLEAARRYGALSGLVAPALRVPSVRAPSRSDRLDAVLTHRLFGSVVFLSLTTALFVGLFSGSAPMIEFLDASVFGALGDAIRSSGRLGGGALESLVVDGIVAGVGGILVFLPQIVLLSLVLAVLEDCGYMARAAFLMDRLLRWCGLSGRSFVPLVSSFACAVPGILAARTIENRRDRLATVFVAPLMSCSARLPVYSLVVAAFLPGLSGAQRGLVFVAAYLLGVVVAVPVAWTLKRTVLRGEPSPFLMELPPYKTPGARSVLHKTWMQAREFVVRAGTVILAASVVVWALSYFPRDPSVAVERDRAVAAADAAVDAARASGAGPAALSEAEAAAAEAKAAAERHANGAWLRGSLLGRAGRALEPVFAPIGWDWKVGVAVLASFPAREVVVSVLGIVYDLEGEDEASAALHERLREARWEQGERAGQPVFDLASALALLVFFALCLQCVSTIAVMRKEMGGWGWPLAAFGVLTALAYLGAWATAALVRAFA